MKNTQFYLLRALTNLHPGAGDANFGIIDKHVQRDTVTNLPAIFASSIKGSVRELFETDNKTDPTIIQIFGGNKPGSKPAETNPEDDEPQNGGNASSNQSTQSAREQPMQGGYIFYEAKLIGLPIRSNQDLFYLATTPALVQEMLDDCDRFGFVPAAKQGLEHLANMAASVREGEPKYFGKNHGDIQLEEHNAHYAGNPLPAADKMEIIFGNRLAVLHVNDFQHLANELPTVARNSLNNGISVNLWYEEIVPRETRFYCPFTSMVEQQHELLEDGLKRHNHLVQIGGNATVGQGLCKWIKL